jgi:23S rRNA pseudouridine1911/1915/1917 synthase
VEINLVFSSTPERLTERLDVFLSQETNQTRSLVQRSIRKGLIQVNSKIITKTGFLLESDFLIGGILELVPISSGQLKPEEIPIEIVYEDEHLLVINKSAGLIVHPTQSLREGTLVNALLFRYQSGLSGIANNDGFRPGIVHRLDKDTSGLMIIAKTNEAHLSLSKQLADRSLKRVYYALALGRLQENTGTIEAPIGRHPSDRKKMAVIQLDKGRARFAKTHWEILEEYEPSPSLKGQSSSLVKVSLDTGRTHQIRVHFEFINHPLAGDPIYGGKRTETKLIHRQCLHAKEIRFIHPISDQGMYFQSELPEDFKRVLKSLI